MPTYPGLDPAFANQINAILQGRPVDRDSFYEKRVMVFHRKDLGTQLGNGITTFFTTNGTHNQFICTLPNGKSNLNEPLIIKEIGFQFEGFTVSESAGTVANTAGWYASVADATEGPKRGAQFQALVAAMSAGYVWVRQRNLVMAQGRLCDFPAGTGATVGQTTTPTVAAAAFWQTQTLGNGQNFPTARYKLADPLVILPDQAISIDLQFPYSTAVDVKYQTAGCFTLYGSSVSRGGVGIN